MPFLLRKFCLQTPKIGQKYIFHGDGGGEGGSKKTLAAGVPMAKVIFSADPRLGMILLPIMIYHPLQIFYCAVLANRYQKKAITREQQIEAND